MQGWNQLVYDYNFSDASNWVPESGTATLNCSDHKAIVTVTGSSDSRPNIRPKYIIPSVSGHKYYFSIDCRFHSANFSKMTFAVLFGSADMASIPIDTDYRYCKIITSNADPTYIGQLYIDQKVNTLAVGDTFEYKNYNIIDLTQLFGAGNEPATVEEFRKMFPADYYPYYNNYDARRISDFTNYTITTGQETFNSISRCGNIVTLTLDGKTNQVATEVQIYTLPLGYRPIQALRKSLSVYSNTAQYGYISIGPGGEVKIYSGTSVRIMESITFVVQ